MPPNPRVERAARGSLSNTGGAQGRHRRVIFSIAGVFFALLTAAWLILKYSPEVTLNFTQAHLQDQLEPKLPKKKFVLNAGVELMNPQVSLTEGSDRIGIDSSFLASLGNRTMPGFARFTGKPHYDQGSGNFYLQDVQVAKFTMSGSAPDFDEVVKVHGPRIVATVMNRFPLYSVQAHPKYGTIAKLALRSVRFVEGQLQVIFANPLLFVGEWPLARRLGDARLNARVQCAECRVQSAIEKSVQAGSAKLGV